MANDASMSHKDLIEAELQLVHESKTSCTIQIFVNDTTSKVLP